MDTSHCSSPRWSLPRSTWEYRHNSNNAWSRSVYISGAAPPDTVASTALVALSLSDASSVCESMAAIPAQTQGWYGGHTLPRHGTASGAGHLSRASRAFATPVLTLFCTPLWEPASYTPGQLLPHHQIRNSITSKANHQSQRE